MYVHSQRLEFPGCMASTPSRSKKREQAGDLLAAAQRDVNTRWQMYSYLASMKVQPVGESGAS